MKSRIKSIFAIVLSLATILSLTACGGGGGGTDTPDTTTTEAVTTAQTNATDPNVQDAASKNETVKNILGDLTVDKKIRWLSWWDIDETSAAVEVFKSNFGIPEEGSTEYGEQYADRVFVYTAVVYANRYDKLATMINGGTSPDIFQFEANNFPYSAYKNMFKSIDGVVDTNGEEWSETRDLMDQFLWGGKNYCAIVELNLATVLWYQKSVVEEAGLDDPYELYKDGKWTWDTFMDLAQDFKDSGEKKYILDGYSPEQQLLCSTGTPLIEIKDGKLSQNLFAASSDRVANFLSTMCKQDYRYPRHIENGFNVDYDAWCNGTTLFFEDGTWRYEETWQKRVQRNKLDSYEDIWFVPWPKDPEADQYYQLMKQDAYMLCSGSKNEAGFKAWTYSCLAARYDETIAEAARDKSKRDYNWTDEQLDFIDELKTTFAETAKFDFKNGIGHDIAGTDKMENAIEILFKDIYLEGATTYTQLREQNIGVIQARIDEMNATVA